MSDPDRVLLLGSLPLGAPWNGADKVLARTIVTADTRHRYIVQTGHDDAWPEHVDAVRATSIPAMPGLRAQAIGARFLLSQTRRARLIHLVASIRRPAAPMAFAVRSWARLAGRPIVHSVPSLTPETFDPRSLVGDVTVVFSEHTRSLLHRLGIQDVEHLFPPVALPATPPADEVEATRSAFDLGPMPVLYPAHLDEGSGAAEAIRAFAKLPPALEAATFVLAVRWRPGEDPEAKLASLRAVARVTGVDRRLRVITSASNMAALIAACAVTALVPKSLEGKMDLPLVLLESLALARPIIVSDQPPISEALLGGGLAVRPGDVEGLAKALASLLEAPAMRASLAAVGRARVQEQADPVRAASAYGLIYDRLVGGLQAVAR